jgi:cytochrome P450
MPDPASVPPGPRRPAIIDAHRLRANHIDHMVRLHRRYGDLFTLPLPGFSRLVCVADPALIKEIFRGDPERFHAGEANATVLEPAVGLNSVLTLDEGEHLRQRKLLLPPFHGESVRRYGELVREIAERDLETWPIGKPFAARPHTQAITLEVILRAVFGLGDAERLARARRLIARFERRSRAVLLYPFLRHDLGPPSPWARFRRARAKLDRFIYEEIAHRRAEGAERGRDDILSLLLAARHEDGRPMSDRELRDELVTVVGAGHETTATALAWALERLLRTPRVLARLRRSLAVGEDDYLDATVKETLRIRPVVTDVGRVLTAPTEIAGYLLPAGTIVMPAIDVVHHRPDLFDEPEEFRPERFLEGEGFSWIPFGGSVRRCVGAAFAQTEMRIVLREIVQRTELRAADPRPERPRIRNITIAPARGARVVLERRLVPQQQPTTPPEAPAALALERSSA